MLAGMVCDPSDMETVALFMDEASILFSSVKMMVMGEVIGISVALFAGEVLATAGATVSRMKVHGCGGARAFGVGLAESLMPLVRVILYVPSVKATDGVNVAVFDPMSKLRAPLTAVFCVMVVYFSTIKVVVVNVVAFIASLKVAVITVGTVFT